MTALIAGNVLPGLLITAAVVGIPLWLTFAGSEGEAGAVRAGAYLKKARRRARPGGQPALALAPAYSRPAVPQAGREVA